MTSWSTIRRMVIGSGLGMLAAVPAGGQTFSYVTDGKAANAAITPGVFLTDANVAAVDAFLSGQSVKVIKLSGDVSPATISAIYGKHKVDFTFADYEGVDATARTQALVERIRSSGATGPAVLANQAFVGNFAFYAVPGDRTSPASTAPYAGYFASGVNVAMEELYPGAPSFRNPASGDSNAPNIRSALFTLPIERLTLTTASLPAGHAHVAYVNRFNNYGNAALDSDGNPHNGYAFATADQLPSRGDFKAQVLHYRLRGASGVQGLDGGVAGYTQEQFQADLADGWKGSGEVQNVLGDSRARLATLDTRVITDGALRSIEEAGVVVSGAYSSAKGKLVMLVSNLDAKPHELTLDQVIGGKRVDEDFDISAGQHQILEFNAAGARWDLDHARAVFVDANRDGTGIPEPGFAMIAGSAIMLGMRRRRR